MEEELNPTKFGKRLAYILRYGALKEGLEVSGDGFINLDDLLCVNLLKNYGKDNVIAEVKKKTVSGKNRFELVYRNGKDFIRATSGRNFAPAQTHSDGKIPRLLEICISYICNNIKLFDLEDFPDSYLLNHIFYRLKFEKKLTNSAMPSVIGRVMDSVDFNGIYITEKTLRIVYERCPNLQSLSLKGCGYLITDNVLQRLLKALPLLKRLNICACESVTDQGIRYIPKCTKDIEKLNISCLPLVTKKALRDLVAMCLSLVELYVQANPNVDQLLIGELLAMRKSDQSSAQNLQIFASCKT